MRAIIHQTDEQQLLALTSIAGLPLLGRQLEWLRSIGCEQLAVEVRSGDTGVEILKWLASTALGHGVQTVLTGRGVAPAELIKRLGWTSRVLVVPADTLGTADLSVLHVAGADANVRATLQVPTFLGDFSRGEVALLSLEHRTMTSLPVEGWGVKLRAVNDALRLSDAILLDQFPRDDLAPYAIEPHGWRVARGVYAGRNALLHPSARLVAPLFIGANTVVEAGAVVGPSVSLGQRAVVERDATLDHCIVESGVVVGEAVALSNCRVAATEYLDLASGQQMVIADSLLLGERLRIDFKRWTSAVAAAVAFGWLVLVVAIVGPAFAMTSLVQRRRLAPLSRTLAVVLGRGLLDVARARRAWVGVTSASRDAIASSATFRTIARRVPIGLIDIEGVIVPSDADTSTRARAVAWYAHAKSPLLDARLVAHVVGRVIRRLFSIESSQQNKRSDAVDYGTPHHLEAGLVGARLRPRKPRYE